MHLSPPAKRGERIHGLAVAEVGYGDLVCISRKVDREWGARSNLRLVTNRTPNWSRFPGFGFQPGQKPPEYPPDVKFIFDLDSISEYGTRDSEQGIE